MVTFFLTILMVAGVIALVAAAVPALVLGLTIFGLLRSNDDNG